MVREFLRYLACVGHGWGGGCVWRRRSDDSGTRSERCPGQQPRQVPAQGPNAAPSVRAEGHVHGRSAGTHQGPGDGKDLLPLITNNNVLLAELDTYEWALKSWSQCSKPCGGGIQYTKYGCRRKSDSRLVHRNFCETSKKPKPIRKRCNSQECSPPTWVAESWGPCSKSCGKLGYQTRVVQCMQPLLNNTQRPVHSKHCPPERPDPRRACNQSLCPAQWRTGAWSQCSVSCGEGIQQRQVVCKGSDNTIGECSEDKPDTLLICKLKACPGESVSNSEALENSTVKDDVAHTKFFEKPISKTSSNEPCLRDKSIFCQMEVLAQYCSIPGYNKLCCESCNKREHLLQATTDLPDPGTDPALDQTTVRDSASTRPDPSGSPRPAGTRATPTITATTVTNSSKSTSPTTASPTSRGGRRVRATTPETSTDSGAFALVGAAAVTQSHGTRKTCEKDTSIFCKMDVLTRYCSIPGYNRLCCQSCGKKDTLDPSGTPPSPSPTLTHSLPPTLPPTLTHSLTTPQTTTVPHRHLPPSVPPPAPPRESGPGPELPPRAEITD
uniref:PLAC domain-containing protein n=1 Tax=Knipowitschia caucasica TaxID=637954 RepID=A0AAV2LGY8_KNICA